MAQWQSRIVGGRISAEAREVGLCLVQHCSADVAVLQLRDCDILPEVGRLLENLRVTEVADVCFVSIAKAELRRGILGEGVVHLSEPQLLAEWRSKASVVLRDVDGVERGKSRRWCRDAHAIRAILNVALIRSKDVHLVLDNRPAEAERAKCALVIGLHES